MNGNDADNTPILADNKESDRQPMPLLANVNTETIRALNTGVRERQCCELVKRAPARL